MVELERQFAAASAADEALPGVAEYDAEIAQLRNSSYGADQDEAKRLASERGRFLVETRNRDLNHQIFERSVAMIDEDPRRGRAVRTSRRPMRTNER